MNIKKKEGGGRGGKQLFHLNLTEEDRYIIEEYMNSNINVHTVTKAIRDLTRLGYMVWKNIDKIENPEFVQQVQKEVEEGSMVDYLASLDKNKFSVLVSIIKAENKIRNKQNPLM